jgi:histidinol dehydrogenase
MIRRLTATEFAAETSRRPPLSEAALQTAAEIIEAVRARGDAALIETIDRYEHRSVCHTYDLWIEREAMTAALAALPAPLRDALEHSAERIRKFQAAVLEPELIAVTDGGRRLEQRSIPVARAAVYVPGGRAAYPSTVLMTVIPALVAGVRDIVMACPPDSSGRIPPVVLAAAALAGVDRILACGGAQAIAALALGTESVPRVDKIAGPGNVYVTAAKKLLYGEVDIDLLAGPSEVLLIADGSADAALLAADLIAQAEHDPAARAVLLSDDAPLLERVAAELEKQCAASPRRKIIAQSLAECGALVQVAGLDEAAQLANDAAPEHLELCVADVEPLLARCTTAGAVFIGGSCPEAIGDYVAGPSHVLPTGGTGRFASGLSANFFRRRFNVLGYTGAALRQDGPAAMALARAEGLDGHAESIRLRLEKKS